MSTPSTLTVPKSDRKACPSPPKRTFAGLISRCAMHTAWMTATAPDTSTATWPCRRCACPTPLVRCHRRWRTQPTLLHALRRTTSTSGRRSTIASRTTTNSPTENGHVWRRQPQEWLPRARRYRSASGCASIVFLIGSVSIMVVD